MGNIIKHILHCHPAKLLRTILLLVAFHSLLIGLVLIAQPAFLIRFAGFSLDGESFFAAQGGAFHILMAVAYLMGALNIEKYFSFIVFSIFVKAGATLFLLVYCFKVDFKWIILLSGILDFVMGLMIFWALQNHLGLQRYHRRRGAHE